MFKRRARREEELRRYLSEGAIVEDRIRRKAGLAEKMWIVSLVLLMVFAVAAMAFNAWLWIASIVSGAAFLSFFALESHWTRKWEQMYEAQTGHFIVHI